ncbi:hypothetical protein DAPPUDRAFT_244081 [Daphnia pulex]|uniref:Uncharacterized protein n=1 Tax=Daphnia pulex TaxID=6669 RepID=E9GK78_DAPPU|nr:hypothetical protein DAPPUDRAFT_244081 [Daphnia pulex]|eukprot:EFX79942.1 hypothetical protein DAPPUDRAFT_244081 [Daphnia pulex]
MESKIQKTETWYLQSSIHHLLALRNVFQLTSSFLQQRERAKFVREEKRRRLNPKEDQAAKNLNKQKVREDRQAEAPDERALRQMLDVERKRVNRGNETEVEHQARVLDQRIRQQLIRQEQNEEYDRALLLAEEERKAVLRHEEENCIRLEAEAKRQAFLRQQEAASILRAMNQRPASDRPRVVLSDDAVTERPARQQHQAGKAAVGNIETPEQQRARLQSQALKIKIFGKMNLKRRDQLGFAIRP